MAGRYNPEKHHRRSLRLKGYNYAQRGAYFVTICTQHRECVFGNVQGDEMVLNNAGEMVQKAWNDLSIKFPGTIIDEFIIMPNHMHGIIFIVGAPLVGALSLTGRTGKKVRGKHVKDSGKHVKGSGKHVINRAGTRPAGQAQDLIII
jgi:REP element-mobilizing transposase RayT